MADAMDDGNGAVIDSTEEVSVDELRERVNAESQKLQEMMAAQMASMGGQAAAAPAVSKEEADSRSIYVGNVDYGATPEELQQHFNACGAINRITILCNKQTGQPKGFAYVEFANADGANNALALNDTVLRGRNLKVTLKRTNVPGLSARGRGRAGRYIFVPYGRGGRGARFHSRGARYHPYS